MGVILSTSQAFGGILLCAWAFVAPCVNVVAHGSRALSALSFSFFLPPSLCLSLSLYLFTPLFNVPSTDATDHKYAAPPLVMVFHVTFRATVAKGYADPRDAALSRLTTYRVLAQMHDVTCCFCVVISLSAPVRVSSVTLWILRASFSLDGA